MVMPTYTNNLVTSSTVWKMGHINSKLLGVK